MQTLKRFNVRVYGILFNELNQVLLADEVFKNGKRSTKFPGGGLELGEGLRDGLRREFAEETGLPVEVKEHFYTTDFFQPSYFDNESQIISIYFLCSCERWREIKTTKKKFDFTEEPGVEKFSFRWVSVYKLEKEKDIILPIDKVVVKKLSGQFSEITGNGH